MIPHGMEVLNMNFEKAGGRQLRGPRQWETLHILRKKRQNISVYEGSRIVLLAKVGSRGGKTLGTEED
jgi:hypothetical protein